MHTVLFRPNVHVMRHIEKKVFFFIRLKSKEKISAISARKKSQIDEELVVIVQYSISIHFKAVENKEKVN